MSDAFTVSRGTSNVPGLPEVDLPRVDLRPEVLPPPAPRERIVITPKRPQPSAPPVPVPQAQPQTPPPAAQGDPWAAAGVTFAPPSQPQKPAPGAAAAKPDTDPWAAAGVTFEPPKTEPKPQVSASKAFTQSMQTGMTFGLGPAIEGAAEASGMDPSLDASPIPFVPLVRPVVGAFRAAFDAAGAREGYEKGRAKAQTSLEAGREQHPYASFAGELGGAMLMPVPGIGQGAAMARVAKGAATGLVGGAAYGAGSGVSEGKSGPEILKKAAIGGAIGAPLGGVIGGAIGPRLNTGTTPGQRAARTAEDLGAPLPRGVTSDKPFVQSSTAKLRQVPLMGNRISQKVEATSEAAGRRVGDIAEGMAGGALDRGAADAILRPGLQGVIDTNRRAANAAYDAVRNGIDQNARFTMPRLDAVLNRIMAERRAAGHANPAQGLEQFRNVAGGTTFNGAHRARVDAREAGNVLVPHPGYNKGDYNQITRAMTADIREMVQAAALRNPRRALHAFDQAETQFGRIAEQNNLLHKLVNSRGEGAIATLLGTSKAKGGNVGLLAQLRASMPPDEFAQIGGVLLHELGFRPATGEFSLSHFVTNWNKISDGAARTLFSPQHLRDISDIVQMGTHIKGALKESSTSHSASLLVALDLMKDAMLIGHDIAAGGLGLSTALGAGTSAVAFGLARWLGNPAQAAALGNWARAYRSLSLSQRSTPAQIAAFNVATRNLSNNLGVPVQNILESAARHVGSIPARVEESPKPEQKSKLNKK